MVIGNKILKKKKILFMEYIVLHFEKLQILLKLYFNCYFIVVVVNINNLTIFTLKKDLVL